MSFEMATELPPHWYLRQVQMRLQRQAMRREVLLPGQFRAVKAGIAEGDTCGSCALTGRP